MMRRAVAGSAFVALFFAAGCAHRAAAPKPVVKRAAEVKAATPLPEWAPENPSPEFLRALKVVRPNPPEKYSQTPREQEVALSKRLAKIFPAAYDYFGTLSDRQIEQLKSSKKLLIPVKSLTVDQRAALDGYFRAFRQAMGGLAAQPDVPKYAEDLLVTLYEFGAKQDLSNVDAGFAIVGHSLNTIFRIRLPDGKETEGFGITIGSV